MPTQSQVVEPSAPPYELAVGIANGANGEDSGSVTWYAEGLRAEAAQLEEDAALARQLQEQGSPLAPRAGPRSAGASADFQRAIDQLEADEALAWSVHGEENCEMAGKQARCVAGHSARGEEAAGAHAFQEDFWQAEQSRAQRLMEEELASLQLVHMLEAEESAEEMRAREAEAASALAARQLADEEAGAAAAYEVQKAERRLLEENDAALVRRAVATGQPVAQLDAAAVLRDERDATFVCPLMLDECDKATDGVCIGNWGAASCNHWVSKDGLKAYILAEAELETFTFACPVCKAAACSRCNIGAPQGASAGSRCTIPPAQIRALLSEEELNKIEQRQRSAYQQLNRKDIAQCPHPDCKYFYHVLDEDGRVEASPGYAKWPPGRDLLCPVCNVQYCLYCGDVLGSLVKWHSNRTCAAFLNETASIKAAGERSRLDAAADETFTATRGKTWQKCPRCDFRAWKPQGHCNRVICTPLCGANFCFLCGVEITPVGSYAHFTNRASPCFNKVWLDAR